MISNVGYWPEDDVEDAEEIDKFVGTGPMCRYVQDLPLLAEIMSEGKLNFKKKVIIVEITAFLSSKTKQNSQKHLWNWKLCCLARVRVFFHL